MYYLCFNPLLSRSSLPDSLQIQASQEGAEGVFVLRKLVKRTRFGPFEAKRVPHLDKQGTFPLRVRISCDNLLLHAKRKCLCYVDDMAVTCTVLLCHGMHLKCPVNLKMVCTQKMSPLNLNQVIYFTLSLFELTFCFCD